MLCLNSRHGENEEVNERIDIRPGQECPHDSGCSLTTPRCSLSSPPPPHHHRFISNRSIYVCSCSSPLIWISLTANHDAGIREAERILRQQMAGVRVRHVDTVVRRGGLLVRQHLPGDQERHGVYPAGGGHPRGGQGLGGCDRVRGGRPV